MTPRPPSDWLALVPAFNESANLPGVVADLRRHWPGCAILVVDDASRDGTRDVLWSLDVHSIRLSQRLGLGGAVRAGLRYARTLGYSTVVRVDGDGQHRADQIERILAPLRAGHADAVQGSRFRAGPDLGSRPARRLALSLLATLLSGMLGRRVTDPTSGFWAFGPRVVPILARHHPTGYPEPELLLFLKRNRLRMAEVPISMRPRMGGRSSLTLPRIGIALSRVLLAMVVVPTRARVAEPRP